MHQYVILMKFDVEMLGYISICRSKTEPHAKYLEKAEICFVALLKWPVTIGDACIILENISFLNILLKGTN